MTERKLQIKQHKFNSTVGKAAQGIVKFRCGRSVNKVLAKVVWNSCIEILCQELLEKGEVVMGSKCGSLHVYKYPLEKFPMYMNKVVKGQKKPQSTNPIRLNYVYRIKYKRGPKVKYVYFSASKRLKERLNKILDTTTKDYRPAPLKIRSHEYK